MVSLLYLYQKAKETTEFVRNTHIRIGFITVFQKCFTGTKQLFAKFT